MAASKGVQRALDLLRVLPRVTIGNLRDNPGSRKKKKRGRGQHSGFTHGCGTKGSGQRQNYMRVGYETGSNPFYLKTGYEFSYNKGHHLRREYPPVSLKQLQLLIDLGRIKADEQIDLTSFCNTKLYELFPIQRQFGVHLTDEGVDEFAAKINVEVQWTSELAIAAVEKNGGVITTAYYDVEALLALKDPVEFFLQGKPIPKRMLPPQDLIEYYTDPKNRGYLADPVAVEEERFKLSQKYGYKLPDVKSDPQAEMLMTKKDPAQVFLGLQAGWLVNLQDRVVLKPKDEALVEYYKSSGPNFIKPKEETLS